MTFRDDAQALRYRIAQQERALAGLEGRRLGLERAVADQERDVSRRIALLERRSVARRSWSAARGMMGLVLGVVGGLVLTGGGCLMLPLAMDSCAGSERVHFYGEVASSTRPDVVVGAACVVALERERSDEKCRVVTSCGGVDLGRESGTCAEMPKNRGLTFRTPAARVPRAFVLSEPLSRATSTSSRGTVRIRIRARR